MSGGGAPKPPELHYEVQREIGGRGIAHGYGMTEVPMIAQGSPHDTDEQLANTDGKPVVGCDVRVVALDGRPAGPDEEGEIRVRGPMVFRGYTDPALTAGTPSTTTGSSAPATSGSCAPTAISSSPADSRT